MFISEFEDCIHGMDTYIMASAPKHHTLFLPEVLVDPISKEREIENMIAAELNVSKADLMKEQKKVLEEVRKVMVKQSVVDVADVDINEQREIMEQFERENKKKNEGISEQSYDSKKASKNKLYKQQHEEQPKEHGSSLPNRLKHPYEVIQVEQSNLDTQHTVNTHHGLNTHRGLINQLPTTEAADPQRYHDQLHHC